MNPPGGAQGARLPSLDGLRGLAILAVIAHNLELLDTPASLPGKVVGALLDHGWMGVQLFFVLSGFLITGLLLDSRGTPGQLKNFFARRALRIFPLYFLALLVLLVLVPATGWTGQGCVAGTEPVWPFLLFLSNITQAYQPHPNPCTGHLWSLAVEEQFYLVWPILLLNAGPRRVLVTSLAVALVALLARVTLLAGGTSPEAVYVLSITRMDALAMGAALAALCRIPAGQARLQQYRALLWPSAALIGLAGWLFTHGFPRTSPAGQVAGYLLLAICFALAVAAAVTRDNRPDGRRPWLAHPVLRLFGQYSFGMYMIHKPLDKLVARPLLLQLGAPDTSSLALSLGYTAACGLAALGLAVISYHAWEAPFLRLKSRFAAAPMSTRTAPAGGH